MQLIEINVLNFSIPIGKLSLYVAAGGINPGRVLPVMLDVGTDNEKLLHDPLYLGIKKKRLTGQEYFDVLDEFMLAVTTRWPKVLIQFEDFTSDKAEIVLKKYRNRCLSFNDDIQGTGSVIGMFVFSFSSPLFINHLSIWNFEQFESCWTKL